MQRIGSIWDSLVSFDNLLTAFKKARRATKSAESYVFNFHLEPNLIALQTELINGSYTPCAYRYFRIYDPKQREISVAPFRDRVVHHALVNQLEPVYEKRFIYDSYATRKNKGTHKAVFRAKAFLRKNTWYLKLDIKHYFACIHHNALLMILEKKIKDFKVLSLCEKIIRNGGENGIGIPIGNLTSQFFANVYLDLFDHWIKDRLGERFYIRYMDDMVIFSNEKDSLKKLLKSIKSYLKSELYLDLKDRATCINSRLNGLSFLGTRIYPEMIRIKPENLKRTIKRLNRREKEYYCEMITSESYIQSVQSVFGLLRQYNTLKLRKKLLGQIS